MNKLLITSLFIQILFVYGCIGTSTSQNRKKLTTANQNTNVSVPKSENNPTFNTSYNFFQNGSFISSATFSLLVGYEGSFFIRGPEIDNYIRKENFSKIQCLMARYPDSTQNKIMVLAANPQFFYDFTKNSKEYYYLISPSATEFNRSFCQKSGILNYIGTTFPGESIAYSIKDVCPNCLTSILKSDTTRTNRLKLFDIGGIWIREIDLNSLTLHIDYSPNLSDNSSISCTSTSFCHSKGLDCCSLGICVNDGQIRSDADQSSAEFKQSQYDIALDPLNIREYPHFYHICGTNELKNPDTTIEPLPDEEIKAILRFQELEELYNCLNPIKGEMSVCTVRYEDITGSSGPYYTGADDLSFETIYTGTNNPPRHSIVEIKHGGEVIFTEKQQNVPGVQIGPNFLYEGNDNFSDKTDVTITHTLSSSAIDKSLKIKYKIDGSCSFINSSLATCTKYYVQGQNSGNVDDHFPASNNFILPFYADINRSIVVKVNGITKNREIHWRLNIGSPSIIEFLRPSTSTSLSTSAFVFDDEIVTINYFVDTNLFKVLESKNVAIKRVNSICGCAPNDVECNLRPVYSNEVFNGEAKVIDYKCVYPQPDVPEPPLQQVHLLSSKSIPVRFFDVSGTERFEINEKTDPQEGTEFKYNDSLSYLDPNNVDRYIGFNEIYGNINAKSGSPKPPLQVNIKAGSTYDIFVDDGTYSSCFYCGNDYYSSTLALFPKNFQFNGGGYLPDRVETNRSEVKTHRSDDMLFGRACWLPATMIPWSHNSVSDVQSQRLSRLAAQHFLFANGYQRDWYGFDYASVIGSFDGVNWFSVGNQRRIKAKTNRLFLAVNSYFGDLTQSGSFRIVVSDASKVPFSGSAVTNDFESDGAQCRQFHTCDTDKNCTSQLGWDYKCETVTGIKTPWPVFDINGFEQGGQSLSVRLFTMIGASTAHNKRCVYRGRGSVCNNALEYETVEAEKLYNSQVSPGMLACSVNNHCQKFIEGIPVKKFNNKIARWGKSVKNQNASSLVAESDLDTIGIGARIIGRPMKYIGDEEINDQARPNLSANKVASICIPGRETSPTLVSNFENSNKTPPSTGLLGDKVGNMGMTQKGNTQSETYYASCPTFDYDGNLINYEPSLIKNPLSYYPPVNSLDVKPGVPHLSASQNISSNALKLIESISGRTLLRDFETQQITSISYEPNRCLRAPGASCFTNLDCAPNKYIAAQALSLDPDSEADTEKMNEFEIRFWQEELVCSQAEKKDITNADYSLLNNKCCRETGKEINIASLEDTVNTAEWKILNDKIPGLDIDLDDKRRYTRSATIYDLIRTDKEILASNLYTERQYPPLTYPSNNNCSSGGLCNFKVKDFKNSWKTLSSTAQRTCCSNNWIRKFADTNSGTDIAWGSKKFQVMNKTNFRCLNWETCTSCGGSGIGFDCSHVSKPEDSDCKARNISFLEGQKYFRFFEQLELIGIPQIGVFGMDYDPTVDNVNVRCNVDPTDQSSTGTSLPIPNTILNPSSISNYEINDDSSEFSTRGYLRYSSLDEEGNFEDTIKTIWSKDQFRCCLPAGTTVEDTTKAEECCTGTILNSRCALPDYTNVSVYFNRFVSSEAAELPDNEFDPYTGYIKSLSVAQLLACQRNVCASGKIGMGVALSNLPVHGHPKETLRVKRFIDGDDASNSGDGINKLYDAGLRWNNHVYCVPDSTASSTKTGLTVIDCNAFQKSTTGN